MVNSLYAKSLGEYRFGFEAFLWSDTLNATFYDI